MAFAYRDWLDTVTIPPAPLDTLSPAPQVKANPRKKKEAIKEKSIWELLFPLLFSSSDKK